MPEATAAVSKHNCTNLPRIATSDSSPRCCRLDRLLAIFCAAFAAQPDPPGNHAAMIVNMMRIHSLGSISGKARTRKLPHQRPSHACLLRSNKPPSRQVVAARASDTQPGTAANVDTRRDELTKALADAVAQEDYREAARLKKQIDELVTEDPLQALQKQLQEAIHQERYKVRRCYCAAQRPSTATHNCNCMLTFCCLCTPGGRCDP
jgi:hypothetical protein